MEANCDKEVINYDQYSDFSKTDLIEIIMNLKTEKKNLKTEKDDCLAENLVLKNEIKTLESVIYQTLSVI